MMYRPAAVALRKESVDRNHAVQVVVVVVDTSLSARRAWIEIDIPANLDADHAVALRKESVDRNTSLRVLPFFALVALRKESVDRNTNRHCISSMTHVALRKESVDRN